MAPEEKLQHLLERKKRTVAQLESKQKSLPEHLRDSQKKVIDIMKKYIKELEE